MTIYTFLNSLLPEIGVHFIDHCNLPILDILHIASTSKKHAEIMKRTKLYELMTDFKIVFLYEKSKEYLEYLKKEASCKEKNGCTHFCTDEFRKYHVEKSNYDQELTKFALKDESFEDGLYSIKSTIGCIKNITNQTLFSFVHQAPTPPSCPKPADLIRPQDFYEAKKDLQIMRFFGGRKGYAALPHTFENTVCFQHLLDEEKRNGIKELKDNLLICAKEHSNEDHAIANISKVFEYIKDDYQLFLCSLLLLTLRNFPGISELLGRDDNLTRKLYELIDTHVLDYNFFKNFDYATLNNNAMNNADNDPHDDIFLSLGTEPRYLLLLTYIITNTMTKPIVTVPTEVVKALIHNYLSDCFCIRIKNCRTEERSVQVYLKDTYHKEWVSFRMPLTEEGIVERFREEHRQFTKPTDGEEDRDLIKNMINRNRLFTLDGLSTGKYDELCKLMTERRMTDEDGTVYVVD